MRSVLKPQTGSVHSLLFTGVFLFTFSFAQGQNLKLIDSLKRLLANTKADRQFDLLNTIGFEFRYSFPDSTIRYCTQAFALGQKLGIKKGLSRPLSFIGLAKANQGDYQGSLDYHNRSIETARMQNDTLQLAHGYNNAGRIYLDEGDLARAYNNFIRAKDLFEQLPDKQGLAYVYRSMADLFRAKKEFLKAIEYSRIALNLRKEIGDSRGVTSACMELGLVYEQMDSTPLALKYFEEADSIARQMNDKVTRAELKIGMAEIFYSEKRLEESSALVNEVLTMVSPTSNQKIYLRAIMLTARFEIARKNLDEAVNILGGIFQTAEQSGNLTFQRDAALCMSKIYRVQNHPDLQQKYNDVYQFLDAKIHNADLNREIEKLQFQLQIEKAERENESLRVRQVNDEALIARQRFENFLLVIIVIFIAALALLLRAVSIKRRKINQKLEEQNLYILHQREEIAKQNEILLRHNNDLDKLNHEQDRLMSIVAHDLKSPFNRIIGLTNILEMEGNLDANQKGYLEFVKESARSGLDLITDLLDVHAWQESQAELKMNSFDADAWFRERVGLFRPLAEAKGSTLKIHSNVGKNIVSEPSYLGRILDNIVSNAIKFSPRNSVIEAEAFWKNGYLQFLVKDSGPGFTSEDQKALYQKFKKLSARPTAGESSNGLGLAIVKTLVDRMEGTIELKTTTRGSVFSIMIPAKITQEMPA